MKKVFFLFMATLSMVVVSCSGSGSNGEDPIPSVNGYAPEASQAISKEFRFYINPPTWAFKCFTIDTKGEGVVSVNSNTSVYEPTVWYKKTGDNTGYITTAFADNYNARIYAYEYNLTFTDPNQGTFTGTCVTSYWDTMLSKEVKKTVKQSGYFAYNMTSNPDFPDNPNNPDDDDDDEEDVDITCLYRSWLYQKGNAKEFITFYKNDTYLLVYTDGTTYQEEKGYCMAEKKEDGNYEISILAEGEKTAYWYRIVYLDSEELELKRIYDDGTLGQSVIYMASNTDGTENKPAEDDGKDDGKDDGGSGTTTDNSALFVEVSAIQSYSAIYFISYTNPSSFVNSSDYLAAGVCYGKTPHPTIEDAKTGTDIINPQTKSGHNISNLERNTTYYIRPYTLKKGVPTYYTETSFITMGGNSIYVTISHKEGNTFQYNYSINMEGSYDVYILYYNPTKGRIVNVFDFGTLKKGDNGSGSYTYPYDWETDKCYLEIIAENTSTGQYYTAVAYKK